MLLCERLRTDLFDANCHLLWAEGASDVLVIDPGLGAAVRVAELLDQRGQRAGAVLLTHGHPDHTWDGAAVAGDEVPVFLPRPDSSWLADPFGQISGQLLGQIPLPGTNPWQAPALVKDVPAGAWEVLPGVVLQMVPSPGHSAGSALFLIGGQVRSMTDRIFDQVALSGDVVFAGSVGRTDLPGGDAEEMRQSLRTLASALDPATVLLPGHGPNTTWANELEHSFHVKEAAGLR